MRTQVLILLVQLFAIGFVTARPQDNEALRVDCDEISKYSVAVSNDLLEKGVINLQLIGHISGSLPTPA